MLRISLRRHVMPIFLTLFSIAAFPEIGLTEISAKCELGPDGRNGECIFQNDSPPKNFFQKFFATDESACFELKVSRSTRWSTRLWNDGKPISKDGWLEAVPPILEKSCSGIVQASDNKALVFRLSDNRVSEELCTDKELKAGLEEAIAAWKRVRTNPFYDMMPIDRKLVALAAAESNEKKYKEVQGPWSKFCELSVRKI